MDCFHYVTYGIFALWFSLNQVFVIKFSVSFATVVEVFARQKTLREQPDTFSSNGQHTWLEIPVV